MSGQLTGTVIATANWRRLDETGEDTCHLLQTDDGWRLSGRANWAEGALDYVVDCATDWQTQRATVSGHFGGENQTWSITRIAHGWALNGKSAGLANGTDIDLAMTPATNTLPIRRLELNSGETAAVEAIWFRPENGGSLTRLSQSYTRRDLTNFVYASPGFTADLTIHPSGLVTRYGDLWEGPVHDG